MDEHERYGWEDISSQVFGKYQYCTQWKKDGMFYADSDFEQSGIFGNFKPKRGALPAPTQGNPEKTAKATQLHKDAAARAAAKAIALAAPRIVVDSSSWTGRF